jgi:2'-5' RNA ligase
MRLFVGVEIDAPVVRRLAGCIDELRTRAVARAPRARVSWVTAERLHVTVRFIGEVDETSAERIAAALDASMSLPFEILIEGVGTFPERGAPRVFWAGIPQGADALAVVERQVSGRLASCGIAPEDRPYRPHVTLARVKVPAGLRPQLLLEGFAGQRFGWSKVDAITLFQSIPSRNGHEYVAWKKFSLSPSAT